jgi:hypothetical protein
MARSSAGVVIALQLALLTTTALAEPAQGRVLLDQVALEPSALPGLDRLRLWVSAVDINGQRIETPGDHSWQLRVGGGSSKDLPYAAGMFAAGEFSLAIIVVIETAFEYGPELDTIRQALGDELVARLPDHAQLAVMSYGDSMGLSPRLGPPKSAHPRLSQLAADSVPGSPALLDAVERALVALRRARPATPGTPLRKLVVVVADGRDLDDNRARATHLGKRAEKDGIRIHSLGYSASDTRRPLLTLGELSRQSLGTFRWIRTASPQAFRDQVSRLRDEIEGQQILTFFVEAGSLSGRRLHVETSVTGRSLVSNPARVPAPSCGGQTCAEGNYCIGAACVSPATGGGSWGNSMVRLVGLLAIAAALVVGGAYFVHRRTLRQVPPPRPLAGSLLVLSGPRAGHRLPLHHGFVVGAATRCDLTIDDAHASLIHAQILGDEHGRCVLHDRGSTTGTFVNGVRVTQTHLHHGVTIRIASLEVRFLADSEVHHG